MTTGLRSLSARPGWIWRAGKAACERQRLVGIKIRAAMCVKRRSKIRAHDIVHAGVVGVVSEVESFRRKVQGGLLAQLESAAQSANRNR